MPRLHNFFLVIFAGAIAPCAAAAPTVGHVHEISFTSSRDYRDPVREVDLWVDFVSPAGVKTSRPGFWDGGRDFRVRFMPEHAGRWTWQSRSNPAADSGLHGRRGEFQVGAYEGSIALYARGRLRLSENRRHLEHADGTPFFWLACTTWNGALNSDDRSWNEYLAERRTKRFTAIQFISSAPWRAAPTDREGMTGYSGNERITLHPEFYRRMDRKFDAINRHGLLAGPVLLWAARSGPGVDLPVSEAIVLSRYQVARYGAHHVLWLLGGDGDFMGNQAERWLAIGRGVFGDQHHGHLVTLHPRGRNWPANIYRDEPWYNIASFQSGHGADESVLRWLTSGAPATEWPKQPAAPIINMELNYEGHRIRNLPTGIYDDYLVRRVVYWSVLVAPVAGVTYGAHGLWWWSKDDTAGPPLDHDHTGTALPWRESAAYPGSTQMKHMRKMFDSVPWWQLKPAPDLLAVQPGKANVEHFIAASKTEEGNHAVIYVPVGGEVRLRAAAVASGTRAAWFDPRTGAWGAKPALTPRDGVITLPTPTNADWVLVLNPNLTVKLSVTNN